MLHPMRMKQEKTLRSSTGPQVLRPDGLVRQNQEVENVSSAEDEAGEDLQVFDQ